MLYMATFTINIPPMLAYIYHTWILWVIISHFVHFRMWVQLAMRRRLPRCPDHEEVARHLEPTLGSCFRTSWRNPWNPENDRKSCLDIIKLSSNTDLWWFMMIYDDVWSCMMIFKPCFLMIYDNLWWFMMMCDGLWWLMMIYPLGKDLTWGKRLNSSGKLMVSLGKWSIQFEVSISMFVYQRVTIGRREFDHQQGGFSECYINWI